MYRSFRQSFLRREECKEVTLRYLASVAKDYFDFEEKFENSEDILTAIREQQSYLNFNSLVAIIHDCGTDDDIEKAKAYEEEFWQYAKRRIFEIDKEISGIKLKNHETLIFVLDKNQLIEVYDFKEKLCSMLGIKDHTIIIESLKSGCIVVTFQVPMKYMHFFYTLPLFLNRILTLQEWHIRSYNFGDVMIPLDWKVVNSIDFSDGGVIVQANNAEIVSATVDGKKCFAIKYTKTFSDESTADAGYIKYLESFVSGKYKDYLPAVKGMHYDESSEETNLYPTIVIDNLKTLQEIPSEQEVSLVSQISVLSAVAKFKCDQRLQLAALTDSVFVQDNVDPEFGATACFCPLYGHSFHIKQDTIQNEKPSISLPLEQLQWMSDIVKLIHYRGIETNTELPEGNILKKMMDQKWISAEDRFRSPDFKTLFEELQHLLGKF